MKFYVPVLAVLLMMAVAVSAKVAEPEKPDARLDQKVTYQAKGELLHKILDDLSKQTGVTMLCGMNQKDWQVRDRKMTIFIKDMPLKRLQETIAEVMHFTWSNGVKGGVTYYRIFQDIKSKKEEQDLRDERKEAIAKKLEKDRANFLSDLDKLDKLTPDELAKLRQDNPYMYVLARKGVGQALAALFQVSPEARAALLSGQDYEITLDGCPPTVAQAAKALMNSYQQAAAGNAEEYNPMFHIYSNNETPDEGIEPVPPTVRISGPFMPEDDQIPFEFASVDMTLDDGTFFSLSLNAKDDILGTMRGIWAAGLDEGKSSDDIHAERRALVLKTIQKAAEAEDKSELSSDDPDLNKPIKLELKEPTRPELPDLLEELAKKSDLQIISDYFRMTADYLTPPFKPEGNLREVLRSAAKSNEKNVKKSRNLVTFTDRQWFRKRPWEVSEECLERWQAAAKADKLKIADLVEMANLTDAQIEHTIKEDEALQEFSSEVSDNTDVLRLYGVLTNAQKQALTGPYGLNTDILTAAQLPYYRELASDYDGTDEDGNSTNRTPTALFLDTGDQIGKYLFKLIDLSATPDPETGELDNELTYWSVRTTTEAIKADQTPETDEETDSE